MQLFLEAIDVWLFRDGRPFDAGSDHRARSLFPPYPSVVQGAIRSHQLVLRGVDLRDTQAIEDAVGTADDVRGLRIRGPFLARRNDARVERLLPQPVDAFSVEPGSHQVRRASGPAAPASSVVCSAPTPFLLGLDDPPAKGEGGLWLREDDLQAYLRGETVAGVPEAELFVRESRLGIGVDSARRTTEEGALYEAEFVRPAAGVGLLVEVEGYGSWPERGVLRIGGEGHGAAFAQVRAAPWSPAPDPLPHRFLLYFATPACFDGGWQPLGGAWQRYFEGEVRLAAAAVGRYESIGGFDWARGNHKPARRYVPAGSVYYFEAQGTVRLRPEPARAAITDHGAEVGCGQVIFEEW